VSIENLTGSNAADTLIGNAAANVLNGGLSADAMTGGDGNDTYFVDNTGDSVIETNAAALGGTDLVNSALASYVLGANVENGRITATGAASLTGNTLNNLLTGGSGANSLTGDAGNDTLTGGLGLDTLNGGAGADTFRFDTTLGATNVDLVLDYSVVDDTVQLENAVFTALTTLGTLGVGNFLGGAGVTGAQDADDFVLYDSITGALYYDADGSGLASAAVRFGTLSSALGLTNADFVVS
jgi:Ca2+-binding RTX toxin-like protein